MLAEHKVYGSYLYPGASSRIPAASCEQLDRDLTELGAHKHAWATLPAAERVDLIDALARSTLAAARAWVEAGVAARDVRDSAYEVGMEWFVGPVPTLRHLRSFRRSLVDLRAGQRPRIPGPVTVRGNGQVVASVFPADTYDRLLFGGYKGDVWLEPGVTVEDLYTTQATAYDGGAKAGKVALVLGAGNYSGIPATDTLCKLFAENAVVVLKMNPVNDYVGPLLEQAFAPLIERGFLRMVYGDAQVGAYLCAHPGVDEVHVTGSDKTFEAIVFGSGPEGARRKAERRPLLTKRVTGELGNVTPVIVVPGPWSPADLDYHAEHVASLVSGNGGCACNTPRVIVQHAEWPLRQAFLDAVRRQLAAIPTQLAYYPGASERHAAFTAAHPEAECFGRPAAGHLPWTLIAGLPPDARDEMCYNREAFCGLCAETAISAGSTAEYLERAVEFANGTLWGTLACTLLVHPATTRDPAAAAAVDTAIATLRYGTVGVNMHAGIAWSLPVLRWGAFPGASINDVQSGIGWVHNTLMFERPEKSVLRTPFRMTPKPIVLVSRGSALLGVGERLAAFEASPSPWKVPAMGWAAMKP